MLRQVQVTDLFKDAIKKTLEEKTSMIVNSLQKHMASSDEYFSLA